MATWPILKTYDRAHLARVALPLGGIGTGTVSLGGRGDLRDWEVMNRPAKGFTPLAERGTGPFFALFARAAGAKPVTRLLEGPLDPESCEGSCGCRAPNHGLPRFRRCSFAAAYPLGQVLLSDQEVPLTVRLEAFNPLIPGDEEASGLPFAMLRFVLKNRTNRVVQAVVCGSLPNFIGMDGSQLPRDWTPRAPPPGPKANRNTFRESAGLRGVFMDSAGVDSHAETWGTLALVGQASCLSPAKTGGTPVMRAVCDAQAKVSFRTAWTKGRWGDALLDFWDDFSADGTLEERSAEGQDVPWASLAVPVRVPPRGARQVTFLLTWHFPNRQTWTPRKEGAAGVSPAGGAPGVSPVFRGHDALLSCPRKTGGDACGSPVWDADRVGNYYTTRFRDAWHVAEEAARELPRLEARTIEFVRAFGGSDLPAVIKEAALFNLANLRSQTCFRTADGRFFGWEGCHDRAGCCHGSCTHVWNYEHATGFLFGALARSMRETEFLHATRPDGLMCFRVNLPLARAAEFGKAAADGQMGCLMRLYREWQLSGDEEFLKRLWPAARRALEFCWIPGGWDADRDGVMEGCQHNTMDVEYYGPNPQMGGWYLGALRAMEEMARHLGESDYADTCREMFGRGSRWLDKHLFNGEYYEHEVRSPRDAKAIAPGLLVGMGAVNLEAPDYILGAGCLVDQLVGQFAAHVCGLGHLLDSVHVKATLRAIMKHNFLPSFHAHFNHLRSFVLDGEAGLLMASYPRGRRPARPFPYFNEVMTGFEYAAAVHMLYEGLTRDGLRAMRAIRARYDGRKRSPFNEAECGHHYARAMASWAAVPAWTGFRYSGVERAMTFAARPGRWFWSNGSAWGTCRLRRTTGGMKAELRVLHGSVVLKRFALTDVGEVQWPAPVSIPTGETLKVAVRAGTRRPK